MRRARILYILICLIVFGLRPVFAQEAQEPKLNFFDLPETPNDKRTKTLVIGFSAAYGATLVALNEAWYSDFEKSSFHFFNDNKEWLQMDKAGHVHTAYFYTDWAYHGLRWTGMDKNKSVWYAAGSSVLAQTTIEVFDGFSERWGASYGDMIANVAGTGLYAFQQLNWEEQRIRVKFSMHPIDYDDTGIIEDRTDDLFGTSFLESALKDYNGQTYWLSANPYSFMNPESNFPKWLNVAIGYGVQDVYGGFSNTFTTDDNLEITIQRDRTRQFYLSPDIDLTKIPTNKRAIRLLLGMANVIKIPAPAFELNSSGKSEFHWLHF